MTTDAEQKKQNDHKDQEDCEMEKKTKNPNVTTVDRVLAVTMASFGIYSALTYKHEYELIILSIIYYLYDLPKTKMDFTIHHLLSITMCILAFYLKLNNLSMVQSHKILINLESTTPFYMLSVYYNNTYTQLMFFLSFLFFRIHNHYYILNSIETRRELFDQPLYYIPQITYYGFFALNLYWFTIMIKIVSKPFKDPKYIFCHKIIPFIRPLKLNLIQFYSGISTYLYHEDLYTAIMNDSHNTHTPQTMVHSIVNSVVSISSIEPRYYKYSIPMHVCKYVFDLDEAIPIGIDTSFYYSTDAFIIYYIFILVRQIKPFYNLNPLAIHILLIILRQYSLV
jgi:hypothetical protein